MIRRVLTAVWMTATVASIVVACDRDDWNAVPGGAALPPAFGARETDGQLRIWTGSACQATTRFALTFDPNQDDRAEWVLRAPSEAGVEVEYLTVGQPVPGLEVAEALPSGFDWHDAESVRISVRGGEGGWGTTTYLDEVRNGSGEHPADTYWFQDVGWLNPSQVAEKDGKSFLASCTHKPAEK